MRRPVQVIAAGLALLACTPRDAPSTFVPPAVTAPSPAGSGCASQLPQPDLAACKWTTGAIRSCAANAQRPGAPRAHQGCVCNGCLVDADCQAKPDARCASLPGGACGAEAKACVYGDECGATGRCAPPRTCENDGRGQAVCRGPQPPRM